MEVKLRSLGQTLSLDDGSTQSFILLELPNGEVIRPLVTDAAAEAITRAFVQSGGEASQRAVSSATTTDQEESAHPALHLVQEAAQRRMPENTQYSPLTMTDDGAMEFGGNGEDLAGLRENLEAAEAAVAHSFGDMTNASDADIARAAAKLRNPLPLPNLGTPVAPLRVFADERGNPVIQGANRVDMLDLTGGNTDGEEDVGQV